MNFSEYLFELLHRPFKLIADIKQFCDCVGTLLDDAKKAIYIVRRLWFLKTCPVDVLCLFGDDYGMPQFQGESDETYRQRLLNVFDWYFWMGTTQGVLRAISYVIDVQCQICEYQVDCWKLGVSQLGVDTWLFDPNYLFIFGLLFERQLTSDEEQLVRNIVNLVKEAHTKFIIQYPTAQSPQIYWRLGISNLDIDTILIGGN